MSEILSFEEFKSLFLRSFFIRFRVIQFFGCTFILIFIYLIFVILQKDDGFPTAECALLCVHLLANGYEPKFGGFGRSMMNAPKFPEPVNFNFLFSTYALSTSSELRKQCLEMSLHTLTKMAHGGIHDHVGQVKKKDHFFILSIITCESSYLNYFLRIQGFSRYSVDAEWHVPHFEKMLYDQAQIIQAYADAYVVTKDSFYSDIVDDIATYVERDLRHKVLLILFFV